MILLSFMLHVSRGANLGRRDQVILLVCFLPKMQATYNYTPILLAVASAHGQGIYGSFNEWTYHTDFGLDHLLAMASVGVISY